MILLLNPPVSPKAPFPNRVVSGLYSLKKFLESKNITCIVRNIEKIDDLMAVNSGISEPPQIIGITALTYQFKSACRVAERLRRLYPDTPIVAGGAAPSGIGADVVKKHPFDICVKGEGEKALLKIYERSVTGRSLRDVPGIIYSSGKNLIDNPGCDLLEENDIPLPGDELYRNGGIFFDHTVRENAALFMFSRGCTGRCSFCMAHRIFPGSVRFIHPDRAVKRIKEIIQTFHIRHFVFDDDNFLSNPDYAVEIAERLAPFDIRFRVNMNAGIPDKKTLLKLKDSGLYKITTGVETIFKDTAGILKKPIHADRLSALSDFCRENNILLSTLFMCALPLETPERLIQTIDYIKALNPNGGFDFQLFQPHPGTFTEDELDKYGTILTSDPDEYFSDNIVFIPNGINTDELTYIFSHHLHRAITTAGKKETSLYDDLKRKSRAIFIDPEVFSACFDIEAYHWKGSERCSSGLSIIKCREAGTLEYRFDYPFKPVNSRLIFRAASHPIGFPEGEKYGSEVIITLNGHRLFSGKFPSVHTIGVLFDIKVPANVINDGENILTFCVPESSEFRNGISIFWTPLNSYFDKYLTGIFIIEDSN